MIQAAPGVRRLAAAGVPAAARAYAGTVTLMGEVRVVSIGTAVPRVRLEQGRIHELLADQPGRSRLGRRLVAAAFDASAVETRHTVIAEFDETAPPLPPDVPPVFFDRASGAFLASPTGLRNQAYRRESVPLALAAARDALAGADGISATDITHVITVSCTGFFAPGPDYHLVRELGLAPSTRRLHVGFMGCYGAFPALRAAADAVLADPEAVVLLVCVELCSLHLRSSDDPDTIVAASVFADGAAAAIVSGRAASGRALRLEAQHTVLAGGEAEMAWTIGDFGFEMTLSSYVPKLLEAGIAEALEPLRPSGEAWAAVEHWAIHPGGRSILDRVQHVLELEERQLEPSRAVLRENGNMSSGTVLFVLDRILRDPAAAAGSRVVATAFGPGLTVESALFALEGAARGAAEDRA